MSAESEALHHAIDEDWDALHASLVEMLPGERRELAAACRAVAAKALQLNDLARIMG